MDLGMSLGACLDVERWDVLCSCLGCGGVVGVTAAIPGVREGLDIDAVLDSHRGVAAGCEWYDMAGVFMVVVSVSCPCQCQCPCRIGVEYVGLLVQWYADRCFTTGVCSGE